MIENEKFYSDYARVFDKDCALWEPSRVINEHTVKLVEQYFNDLLKLEGFVFLRDIYEKFGWPLTQASIYCGWHKNSVEGDYTIDFQIFVSEDENDPDLIIDFNVDGVITKHFPLK